MTIKGLTDSRTHKTKESGNDGHYSETSFLRGRDRADVSNQSQVQTMVERIVGQWGTVDILVNNAAIVKPVKLEAITVEQWDQTMNVNVRGPFLCAQAVAPYMRRQHSGCIVNIGSPAGTRVPGTICPAYSASKAALVGLTYYLSRMLRADGIRVNCMAPSATRSDTQAELARAFGHVSQMALMEAEEVAEMVVWLCSTRAKHIHGECVYASADGQW